MARSFSISDVAAEVDRRESAVYLVGGGLLNVFKEIFWRSMKCH